MGLIQELLSGLVGLIPPIADFAESINPCPFKEGFAFNDSFSSAFGILGNFVDLGSIAAITISWAGLLGLSWVLLCVYRWVNLK